MKKLLTWLLALQRQGYETVTIAEVISRITAQSRND